MIDRRLSVAPMMDYTDRHFRYFLRLKLKHLMLYTEMVHAMAILHGPIEKLLAFHPDEHPVGLQVGGSDPQTLAQAAKLGEQWGYDEINLNVGCPSERVQSGHFGACLMKTPELVAECLAAMQTAVSIPVTVKCRVGVDDKDTYDWLRRFVNIVKQTGCQTFIIHARKAWLQGLNPKQNRTLPTLNQERVYQLKQDMPELEVILNGGVQNTDDVKTALEAVDGVMIGRPAYHHPMELVKMEQYVYDLPDRQVSPQAWLRAFLPYLNDLVQKGESIQKIVHHVFGMFSGFPGAKHWRHYLTEESKDPQKGLAALEEAINRAFVTS